MGTAYDLMARNAQFSSHIEQVMLDIGQQGIDIFWQRHAAQDTNMAVQLVHVAQGVDQGSGFGQAAAVAQTCRPIVAGAGADNGKSCGHEGTLNFGRARGALGQHLSALVLVKVDGVLVPVQYHPLQATTALGDSHLGQMAQDSSAQTVLAMGRVYIQILQIDAAAIQKAGVVVKPHNEVKMTWTKRGAALALGTLGVVAGSAYVVVAQAQEASASGEVRRLDAEAGKITIKHGEISDLELPAMTLVYKIDPALLTNIKPGDKVKFTAKRDGGDYVVTKISK
uniref:DUF3471 domain-containing protein n=1 Tax=Steinernema glaseri TaxID=37863 RepID=A0A1I7Z576_9BILA